MTTRKRRRKSNAGIYSQQQDNARKRNTRIRDTRKAYTILVNGRGLTTHTHKPKEKKKGTSLFRRPDAGRWLGRVAARWVRALAAAHTRSSCGIVLSHSPSKTRGNLTGLTSVTRHLSSLSLESSVLLNMRKSATRTNPSPSNSLPLSLSNLSHNLVRFPHTHAFRRARPRLLGPPRFRLRPLRAPSRTCSKGVCPLAFPPPRPVRGGGEGGSFGTEPGKSFPQKEAPTFSHL